MQFEDKDKKSAPLLPEDADVPLEASTDEQVDAQEELAAQTDTAETDDAIDHILKEEADALLAIDDEHVSSAQAKTTAKPNWRQKLVSLLQLWWYNKWARWGTLGGLFLLLVVVFALPPSRYFVLNTVGVRATASVVVVDQSTDLPLKNALVKLGGAEATTNERGEAALSSVKLGRHDLVVERIAFADLAQAVTVGWGSNPFGTVELEAVGAQYVFIATDYLSGKPIPGAEAASGQASAFADEEGKITLALEDPEDALIEVSITASGYRQEQQVLEATTIEQITVEMVPAQPEFYISKQSGKYDLYRMDVDGKNKKVLLAGTGNENADIRLVSSPDGAYVALSSIRSGARDSNGYPLRTLTIINVATGETKAIDQAQHFTFIDWNGDTLVYQVTYAAPSAATNQRQRLVAYDIDQAARTLLVTTDYFAGFIGSGEYVYFALAQSDPSGAVGLYRIKHDGTDKQRVLDKRVWGMVRTSVAKISIETPDGWYDYTLGASQAQKGDSPTNMYSSRVYTELTGSEKSLWLDDRDGKGAAILHDKKTGQDTVIVVASGLTAPLRWLSDTAFVYRIQTSGETADYVQSINGGDPKKLTDVTATAGFTPTAY